VIFIQKGSPRRTQNKGIYKACSARKKQKKKLRLKIKGFTAKEGDIQYLVHGQDIAASAKEMTERKTNSKKTKTETETEKNKIQKTRY